MTPSDTEKAARLYSLVVGQEAIGPSYERLRDKAQSYQEFRLLLVADHELLPDAAGVLARWSATVERVSIAPDSNELMHTLETLSSRQNDLERRLREPELELLEKLRQLDSIATSLFEIRKETRELRAIITQFRQRLVLLDEKSQHQDGGRNAASK